MKQIVWTTAAVTVLGLQACAMAPQAPTHTELKDCVIQEVIPGKDMTGAFVRFVHAGPAVEIVRAEVPSISPRVELHSMELKNGVMEMIPLTSPSLAQGERVFRKGADHVMLFDIARKPAVGSHHEMTVHFSDGSRASCTAVVKSVAEVMREAGLAGKGHQGGHGQMPPAHAPAATGH
ncbi:MAG: copper chaperone PCu(A)C [Lautropia sp.]|nr:copper chaperone PCu(A)C [Lautropia sp.]